MRDKRKPTLANGSNGHDWAITSFTAGADAYLMCAQCGKCVGEVDEQEEPAVCWSEVTESDSPYLIPPQVESAHPIEAGDDFWVGDEWWPLSIKATEGER